MDSGMMTQPRNAEFTEEPWCLFFKVTSFTSATGRLHFWLLVIPSLVLQKPQEGQLDSPGAEGEIGPKEWPWPPSPLSWVVEGTKP